MVYNINRISRAIVYENLHGTPIVNKFTDFERTDFQLTQIIKETNVQLILRAATRNKTTLIGTNFTKLKNKIDAIRKVDNNIIIIGCLFCHAVDYVYTDEITGQIYPKTYTYDNWAYDPAKFGGTGTKYGVNYSEIYKYLERWYPDFTVPEFQDKFVNQAKKMLEAGVDGFYLDLWDWQYNSVRNHGGSAEKIKQVFDAMVTVTDKIKALKTNSNNTPILGRWIYDYTINNDAYPFDFLLTSFLPAEMTNIKLDDNRWTEKVNSAKKLCTKYSKSVRIIADIDWNACKDFNQMYKFTQISDKNTRIKYENNILNTFKPYLDKKGILFALPIHGGIMCNDGDVCGDTLASCIIKSFGTYRIFDSKAPEFDIYNIIVDLINRGTSGDLTATIKDKEKP